MLKEVLTELYIITLTLGPRQPRVTVPTDSSSVGKRTRSSLNSKVNGGISLIQGLVSGAKAGYNEKCDRKI